MNIPSINANDAAYVAIAVFLAREFWEVIKGSAREQIKATQGLVVAMVELKVELKNLAEKIQEIPQIRKDVNEAHAKIRELKSTKRESTQ